MDEMVSTTVLVMMSKWCHNVPGEYRYDSFRKYGYHGREIVCRWSFCSRAFFAVSSIDRQNSYSAWFFCTSRSVVAMRSNYTFCLFIFFFKFVLLFIGLFAVGSAVYFWCLVTGWLGGLSRRPLAAPTFFRCLRLFALRTLLCSVDDRFPIDIWGGPQTASIFRLQLVMRFQCQGSKLYMIVTFICIEWVDLRFIIIKPSIYFHTT